MNISRILLNQDCFVIVVAWGEGSFTTRAGTKSKKPTYCVACIFFSAPFNNNVFHLLLLLYLSIHVKNCFVMFRRIATPESSDFWIGCLIQVYFKSSVLDSNSKPLVKNERISVTPSLSRKVNRGLYLWWGLLDQSLGIVAMLSGITGFKSIHRSSTYNHRCRLNWSRFKWDLTWC